MQRQKFYKKDETTLIDEYFDDDDDGGYGMGEKAPHQGLEEEEYMDNVEEYEDEAAAIEGLKKDKK